MSARTTDPNTAQPRTTERTVDAGTVRRWRAESNPPRVLDVRTPSEFETARIPDSANVPIDHLDDHVEAIRKGVDDRLVVVCQSGSRSERARAMLADAGMHGVTVLDGGMNAWQSVGGEVERGDPKWSLERQVRLVAGSIVLVSALVALRFRKVSALAGAVGGGLVFSAVTDTCGMANALAKIPYNRGSRTEVEHAVTRLAGS